MLWNCDHLHALCSGVVVTIMKQKSATTPVDVCTTTVVFILITSITPEGNCLPMKKESGRYAVNNTSSIVFLKQRV